MKTEKWMRYLAAAIALALVMAAPLQASEFTPEDMTGASETVSDEAGTGDMILPEDEILPAEADLEGSVSAQNAAPAAEISEEDSALDVVDISEVALHSENGTTIGTTSSTLDEWNSGIVWLHVVNGSFSGTYNGVDISKTPSVKVQLYNYNWLPTNVESITVTRSHGKFRGWYTKAPTEELQKVEGAEYSVWHTVEINGEQVQPGGRIPEGVHVLYAVFDDEDEVKETDRRVEYYLDWNGINGMYGECLTCTDSYAKGGASFTPERAAVYSLNYQEGLDPELDKKLEGATATWEDLKKFWESHVFDGYTFLGWSTDPEGENMVWENTGIKNGMSFYAQWTKGTESSKTFNRNPEPDPLEAVRIVAAEGTAFVSGTLSSSKDAKNGGAFRLKLFCTPVGAEPEELTWSVAVRDPVTDLKDLFKPSQAVVGEVKADNGEASVGGIKAKAEGCMLTITNTDGKMHVVTVGAAAKDGDGRLLSAPSDATLSFTHTWAEGTKAEASVSTRENQKETPDCTEGVTIQYTCTVCGETKEEKIAPLGHVYNFSEACGDEYYSVEHVKEPTCTEEGENKYTYRCLRCKEPGEVKTAKVPALGHDWGQEVTAAISCNKDMVTRTCLREGCTAKEVSLVPADHPDLHEWTETRRDHNTCTQDTVYESCQVCGETRKYTEAASNEHAFAYDSSVRIDCQWVEYTFKCAYGCGATKVDLKKEEGHDWGGWTVTTSMDKETGAMKSVRERSCSLCEEKETEVLENWPKTETESEADQTETESEAEQEIRQTELKQEADQTGRSDEQNGDPADNHMQETEPAAITYAPISALAADVAGIALAQTNAVESAAAENAQPEMKSGWKTVGNRKYYIAGDGEKQTGWQKIGKKKYYFDKNGVMQTGWQKIGKKQYYFGKNGVMRTGWQKIGKKQYYFGKNGVMRTGIQKIGKKKYSFDENGVLEK